MIKKPQVQLFDLTVCLSDALDLASPAIADHHKQVAFIAFSIGEEIGLPIEQRNELALAGALHDAGAFSLRERIDLLQFEIKDPYYHAELGYLLLRRFKPLTSVANLVRFHHVPWNEGEGCEFKGKEVSTNCHLLHLADRVAVLMQKDQEILGQVKTIVERVNKQSGKMFMPRFVDAFTSLATKEYFWLDATSKSITSVLGSNLGLETVGLDMEGLLSLASLFRSIIDFRSRFTANHSAGVAASAEALAGFVGFPQKERRLMKVAGYLHDLGKLAVPNEILEKPDKLTEGEFNVVRSHTFHTYRTLETIADLDLINSWASFHHERLDGSGYPFHLEEKDISLGSRIMAVADVFTAITEDRPYRKGMNRDRALQVLRQMSENSALDAGIVSLMRQHFDEINSTRVAAQTVSTKEYEQFSQNTRSLGV